MSRKNQGRTLLIAAGVVLLMGGAYAGITVAQKKAAAKKADEEAAESEALDESLSLLDFDSSEITNISYTNPDTSLSFTYDADTETWSEDSNPDYPLQQSYVKGIATTVAKLKASSILEENLDNSTTYGLDDPSYVITIKLSDGTEHTLTFGILNTYLNEYYMTLDDQTNVYMMGTTLPGYASYTLDQMLSVEAVDLPSSDEVKAISLQGIADDVDSWSIDYCETDGLTYAYYPYTYWYYENADGDRVGADADTVSALIDTATGLSISSCEAYNVTEEEMASYGLSEDAPSTAILTMDYEVTEEDEDSTDDTEATVTKETVTVLVGDRYVSEDADAEDMYYVRQSGGDIVYIVKASDIDTILGYTKYDFPNQDYAMVLSSNIESIQLKFGDDQEILYELKPYVTTDDDGEELTATAYYMNGTKIDSTYVIAIQYELTALAADRSMKADDEVIDYDPELEIIYKLKDCEGYDTVTIGYTPYNDNYDMVTVNGKSELLINKNDVASMVSDLGEALDVLDQLREQETETETETEAE